MDSRVTEDTIRLRKAVTDHKAELEAIFAEYEVKNPRIFGSVARGNATSTSDVDILVDSYKPDLSLFDVVGLVQKIERAIGAKIDLVRVDRIKPNRRSAILEGQHLVI